jgi:FkbH-like protein
MEGDPALFVRKLDHLHLFDSNGLTDEDLNRAESYKARIKSESLRTSATDLVTYLSSLQMVGEVWVARQEDLSRLTQMEAKTNQFNLTTRRWSSDQLGSFMTDVNHDVLCFRIADRFTDHGLVGSMVVSYEGDETRILSWLLSCRVFSRTCEEFMLSNLVSLAMMRGISRVRGEFIATEKNKVVADLFSRLGFNVAENDNIFLLETSAATVMTSFISAPTRD